MKLSDIVANARITCEQNNIQFDDFLKLCIMEELGIDNQFNPNDKEDTDIFAESLEEEYDLIWDLQPTLEEDEDHAFAVQHARDIYDVLLGRF